MENKEKAISETVSENKKKRGRPTVVAVKSYSVYAVLNFGNCFRNSLHVPTFGFSYSAQICCNFFHCISVVIKSCS